MEYNLLTKNKNIFLTPFRYGYLCYLSTDVYVGKSVEQYGEWSELEVDIFRQILKPGDIVVEAGANIGSHTIALGQMIGPTGQLFAFEPQRMIHKILAANIVLNELSNVTAIHAGLGDQVTTAYFPSIDYTVPNNFGGMQLQTGENSEAVDILTLDEAMDVPSLAFIKADVEGMELALLKGSVATIKKHRPLLYLECNEYPEDKPLFDFIKGFDYSISWHITSLFNKDNFKGLEQDIFGGAGSYNILCVPNEKQAMLSSIKL